MSSAGKENETTLNSDEGNAGAAADAQKMPPPSSGAGVVTPVSKSPAASEEYAAGTAKAEERQGEAEEAGKEGEASKVGEGRGEAGKSGNGHGEAGKSGKGHGDAIEAGEGQPDAAGAVGPDPDRLGCKISNMVQMFNLKRTKLDASCKEGIDMSLMLHQVQRQLECERSESHELHQQLELSTGAVRRWQEERGGLTGEVARLKVQLAAARAETASLKGEGRELQLTKLQLTRQLEEMGGQLQCNVDYTDRNNKRIGRLMAVHENLRSNFQKLVAEQQRFAQTIDATKTTVEYWWIRIKHYECTLQERKVQLEALETEIAQLKAQLTQKTSISAIDKSMFEFTKEDEVSVLQEMVSDLQRSIASTQNQCGACKDLYADLVNTTLTLSKKEEKLQEKYKAELEHTSQVEVAIAGLTTDLAKIKDNLRIVEQELRVERERAKKPECVERGVQCGMTQRERVTDVEESEKSDAVPEAVVDL